MNSNRVFLIGYVGQDLAALNTEKGTRRVGIRMTTHYKHRNDQGEEIDHTVWHNVVAWDKAAEFAERSFVKGSKIMVEGSIDYRKFRGRNGTTIYFTRIKAHSLMNLDR